MLMARDETDWVRMFRSTTQAKLTDNYKTGMIWPNQDQELVGRHYWWRDADNERPTFMEPKNKIIDYIAVS